MKDLATALTEANASVFAALGLDARHADVRRSDRPDLGEFQCNGALAAAKAAGKKPPEIASEVAAAWTATELADKPTIAGPGLSQFHRDAAGADRARANHRRRSARRRLAGRAQAPRRRRLWRAQRRQGHACRPPARVDHRRERQAHLSLPRRRGVGRCAFRRLGLPDGPRHHRARRRTRRLRRQGQDRRAADSR